VFFLNDDPCSEALFKILRPRTLLIGIEKYGFFYLFFWGTHFFYLHLGNHGFYS
jgi:hypothetical protein